MFPQLCYLCLIIFQLFLDVVVLLHQPLFISDHLLPLLISLRVVRWSRRRWYVESRWRRWSGLSTWLQHLTLDCHLWSSLLECHLLGVSPHLTWSSLLLRSDHLTRLLPTTHHLLTWHCSTQELSLLRLLLAWSHHHLTRLLLLLLSLLLIKKILYQQRLLLR